MKWLTEESRLIKSSKPNEWLLIDNEVYQDEDGSIYLTPRNYKTDNYSIPDWIAFIAGNKSKYDVRPAHIHDFGCQYRQLIRIRLTEKQLIDKGYLKNHKNLIVCDDIPIQYLELIPVTKWQIDCLFKRAMKATGTIPKRAYNAYRAGVFLNVGWLTKKKAYNLNDIYKKGV